MQDTSQKLDATEKRVEGEVLSRQAGVNSKQDLKEEGLFVKSTKNAINKVFNKDREESKK